jgi:hypothetical protein
MNQRKYCVPIFTDHAALFPSLKQIFFYLSYRLLVAAFILAKPV